MGHSIIYIVDLSGRQFNELLPINIRLSRDEIGRYAAAGADYEVGLPQTQEIIGVDVSGCATRLCLSYKYTQFLHFLETKERVAIWESQLRNLVPSVKIVRMSESLANRWEAFTVSAATDGFWFRHSELVTDFFQWIELQDRELWDFLPV